MLTIGQYLRHRGPEVPLHDGECECSGGSRRGALLPHLPQRGVQGNKNPLTYHHHLKTLSSGCLGPGGHPDSADHERARHHEESPDQGLGARQQRLEAGDQGHQEDGRGPLHVSDQHRPHAEPARLPRCHGSVLQ